MGKEVMSGKITPSSSVTFTNKTIAYSDNTLTGVQPTITGGASSITSTDLTASKALVSDSNGKVGVSSVTSTELGYVSGVTSGIQSQINSKQSTIDNSNKLSADLVDDTSTTNKFVTASDKTTWSGKQDAITGAASSITSSNLTASKVLVSDASGKVAASSIDSSKIVSTDGTQTLTNKTIDRTSNTVNCTPTVISTTQTITPTKEMNIVVDTDDVALTLGSGPYDGYVLPITIQADGCSITYTDSVGTASLDCLIDDHVKFIWNDSYWIQSGSVPITGIDDNNLPFAYNIDSLVKPEGVIHITGEFKDGTPFDYGLGRLVSFSSENAYSETEHLTGRLWTDGKPTYEKVYTGTNTTYVDAGSKRSFYKGVGSDSVIDKMVDVRGTITINNGALGVRTYSIGSCTMTNAMTEFLMTFYQKLATEEYHLVGIDTPASWNITSVSYDIITEYTKLSDSSYTEPVSES